MQHATTLLHYSMLSKKGLQFVLKWDQSKLVVLKGDEGRGRGV